jgi:hypothetical protein
VPGPRKPTRFDLEAERDLERGVSHRILITYEGAGCPEYLAYYQEWQARGSGIRLSGLPQKMSTRGARLWR